jgi:chromosomal replication initiator protein
MNAASRSLRLLSVPEQRPALLALENLLPEPSNRSANGAARPSLVFVHGPSGGGKTSLVHWLTGQLTPPASARIVSADGNFASERSSRGGSENVELDDEPDLLVVEDLQFLSPNSVETFLARLDRRQAHGLATAITASAGSRHLRFRGKPFPARLTSRLAAGLVVAVPLPSPTSCRAILDEFLRDARLAIPSEVVAYLAEHGRSIRSLEGSIHQLELLARLEPGPFQAAPLLDHFRKQAIPNKASVERIVHRVAGYFQVSPKEVRGGSRRRGFVVPRHVSMYLARRLTPLSFQQIGAYFGGCDHATVLHACRRMERTLVEDPDLGGAIRHLHDELA